LESIPGLLKVKKFWLRLVELFKKFNKDGISVFEKKKENYGNNDWTM
jgi:hypothetical protein